MSFGESHLVWDQYNIQRFIYTFGIIALEMKPVRFSARNRLELSAWLAWLA
jgi:hypothetical protein